MNGETMLLNRESSGDYINTTLCVFKLYYLLVTQFIELCNTEKH